MTNLKWTARRKLFASLIVLGLVLVIASIAQITGQWNRENPYRSSNSAAARPMRTGERAVFGGADPRPSATSETPPRPAVEDTTRARTAPPSEAPVTNASTERASIERFLARWRDTVAKGDVEGQTELYAPTVSRFFRQRNVSNATVKKTKSQMMSLYPTVSRYDISEVKVESNTGSDAVVSFRKEWDMNGRKRFAGAERQRLRLRRMGGDWKIVSEEETKVYWTKRG